MIGFLVRGLGFGGSSGGAGGCLVALIALCALFGAYKCTKCKLRNWSCCRCLFRTFRMDSFDSFDLMVIVHTVAFTSAGDGSCSVRVTAGEQVASVESQSKVFHQPLSIFVEQGTDLMFVELCDYWGKSVFAKLELNITDDIIKSVEKIREKTFTMKAKSKGVINPKVTLTISTEGSNGAASNTGLVDTLELGDDPTAMMVRAQLMKVVSDDPGKMAVADLTPEEKHVRQTTLLAKGCSRSLNMLTHWGNYEAVYMAIRCPPTVKKFTLGIWNSEQEYQSEGKPKIESDIMKILGVQAHPSEMDEFIIQYMPSRLEKKQMKFTRIDRARDVWVEMLGLLLKTVHDHENTKKKMDSKAASTSASTPSTTTSKNSKKK